LQIAEALGEMGAKVALTARKKDELDAAVAHLAKIGIEASGWPCDLGKREQIARSWIRSSSSYGKIDILVNNAGAVWAESAEKHPVEAWDKLVALNMTANFVLSQAVAMKSMIPNRRGGSSMSHPSRASPPATRASCVRFPTTQRSMASVGLTRQFAAEWGAHGITVNAICPGFFPSKMTNTMLGATGKIVLEGTPTGRLGNEEDLKGLAVLLASEASRHITGQAIAVDGGASVI
jgi:gluconate 5-dehydrogenase